MGSLLPIVFISQVIVVVKAVSISYLYSTPIFTYLLTILLCGGVDIDRIGGRADVLSILKPE